MTDLRLYMFQCGSLKCKLHLEEPGAPRQARERLRRREKAWKPGKSSARLPPMASKKISILLADVDGTLVDSQKRITARAEAAIRKLAEAGIKFAVTSGRPPRGMKMIVEQIKLSTPIGRL